MRIIVTTSDKYLHLIPVFTYLFNKYWGSNHKVKILGYNKPECRLPDNFIFYSHGKQGDVSEWSTDIRWYVEHKIKETHFILLMEDCFIKSADVKEVRKLYFVLPKWPKIGRFDLTNDVQKRRHTTTNAGLVLADSNTNYRFSTQASIWNKKFLLQYLTPGLTPWEAEKQECKNDGWGIFGYVNPPLIVNEGVRKSDPHTLDLNGFPEEDIIHINKLLQP